VILLAVAERIAILTPLLPASRPGGVEVFSRQIQEVLGPAQVFAAPEASERSARFLVRFGLLEPYRASRGARAFRAAHAARPFDLVLANGLSGWPLRFSRPDVPMIQVYHFTLAGLARRALPLRGDRLTTARVGGWFDGSSGVGKEVVAVSDSVRREVLAYYGLGSTVIPNAVDVNRFRMRDRRDARDRLGLPRDRTIALFVGRAEYAKGFDRLRDIAKAMGDVLFLSVSQAAAAPENVRFLTDVPHESMPFVYAAADVFVSPSRYEGFNLSLLEALACETPAVVTRAACAFGDEPSDLANVVETPTPDAFAEAIRSALKAGPRPGVRDGIEGRYSFEVFRRNWQRLAASVLERASP
jgi:glycosyltransferase involved in cell wall biosynthesis